MIEILPNKLNQNHRKKPFITNSRSGRFVLVMSRSFLFISLFFLSFLPIPTTFAQPALDDISQIKQKKLGNLSPEELEQGRAFLKTRDHENKTSGIPNNETSSIPSEKIDKDNNNPSIHPKKTTRSTNRHSQFESYLRGQHSQEISLEIDQFGYDLFHQTPASFSPVDMIPVAPDYLLGPGDEIRINVWGKLNVDHVLEIDRDGKIVLPQLGALHLAGLSFAEAKSLLLKESSRYYKASEVKMNVSMGRLRSIRAFVVGKAAHPGSYTLSSFSTLINALFAAGGPSKVGTMRDIMVKRKGKTIVHLDLYDLLLSGNKGKDIRLMSEDVIFIPGVGPLIGIAGNVNVPAIYESLGEMTLRDLIKMAGGISARGYLQRVQVERVFENKTKIVLDVDLDGRSGKPHIPDILLSDGDLVRVFSIEEKIANAISLKGNVVRPGTYEWKNGMRLKDLLKSFDDLLPDTFLDYVRIERRVPPDQHREYLSSHLGKLLLEADPEENILLRPDDIIIVYNQWELTDKKQVRIRGAVNKPDAFEYRPNMKLSDLLYLAGGLKDYAFLESAELTRVIPTSEGPEIKRFFVDLEGALSGESASNIHLAPDDHISVQTVPEWELYRTVLISGEVRFPGAYTSKKGDKLSSLIERAGGYTENAYLKGAIFSRKSVRELQQRQLNEAIDRLESQLLSQSATSLGTALSPEAARQEMASTEQRKTLITKMRAAKALGRMTIELDTLESFESSPSNVTLEEGDTLTIPEKPQQIQVIGAVYNQTAFIFDEEGDVGDYLEKAGGFTKEAAEEMIYVLKVDGTALSKSQTKGLFRRALMSRSLDPGDTIVVPEDIDKISWLKETKDITQILFQMAVTAGVLIATF